MEKRDRRKRFCEKILCVGLVVSFGVILSLGFSKKSYAKIDHNFSFSDGGNQQGGGSQQYITVSSNNSILDMGKGIDLQYLDGFVGKMNI